MGQCQDNATIDKFRLMTEEIPGTKTPGFSHIYRKIGVDKMDYSPAPGVQSLLDVYNNTAK